MRRPSPDRPRRPAPRRRLRPATWVAALIVAAAAVPASAQQLLELDVQPDSVEIGDPFTLRFVVELPPGTLVFLPDSIDDPSFASYAPVRYEATPVGAGVALDVRYSLLAFRSGSIAIEGLELFIAWARDGRAAGLAGEGDVVGSWEGFREAPASVPSARRLALPEQRVEVADVLVLDDVTTQIAPRPAADVWGGDRHWPATLLAVFFGLVLAGVGFTSVRDWMAVVEVPPPPPDPREVALTSIDDLLASDLLATGAVRPFYRRLSDVVRRWVESFAEPWGPAWTSTELMADLQGPRRSEAIARSLDADAVHDPMAFAERVKFGGLRPDATQAERDARRMRAWIESAVAAPRRPSPGVEA